jgi:hypothetical protein
MKINRYLFTILAIFFLTLTFTYIRVSMQTVPHEKDLKEAYKKANTGRSLQYIKVMDYRLQKGTAAVFAVETVTGKTQYETGRMLKFTRSEKAGGTWQLDKKSDTPFWDSSKNSGNKFTFPPFIGKDISILLKK